MLRLVDWYLIRQFAVTVLFTLVLLIIIWLAPEILFKLIQGLVSHKLTLPQFGWMLGYHIPPVIQQCMPMALLFGSLFAIRRLSLHLEWSAMLSAGVSPLRLAFPVLLLGAVAASGQWLLQEVVIPYTSPRLEQLYWQTQVKPSKITPFLYVQKNAAGNPERFFFIGDVNRRALSQFIVLDYHRGLDDSLHIGQILKAATGQWMPASNSWQLRQGQRYVLDGDGVYQATEQFETVSISTPPSVHKLLKYQFYRPTDMSRPQLTELIRLLEQAGQSENLSFYRIRLFQKWTPIIACLLFGLFGIVLGLEPVRSRRQDSLILGALVLFMYGVSQPLFTNLGVLGVLPPWLAALAPVGMAGCVTGIGNLFKNGTLRQ
jgi:lipopolysaccharide export system permease protein